MKAPDGWVHITCGHCGNTRKFTTVGAHTYTTHPHTGRRWNLYVTGRGGDGGGSAFGTRGGRGSGLHFVVENATPDQRYAVQVGAGGQPGVNGTPGQNGGSSGLTTRPVPPPVVTLPNTGISEKPTRHQGRGYRLRRLLLWDWSERRAYWKLTKAERALLWCFDVPPSILTGANYLNAERERELRFEQIRARNLAVFKHEMETPMRAHHHDASCCR